MCMRKFILYMKTFVIFLLVILAFVGCAGVIASVDNNSSSSANNDGENVIEIPSQKVEVDFSKLSYCAFGDSITYGSNLFDSSTYRWETPYPTAVAEELNLASYENKGKSGATLSSNSLGLTSLTDVVTSNKQDFNIISLLAGVNDFNRDLPIGLSTDTSSETIYGALDVIAKHLTETYPNSFIFFMTPLKFVYNDLNFYTENNVGYLLEDVCIAVKIVAQRYNIPVLDLYNESNFSNHFYDAQCDGLHPNQEFIEESLAPQISQFIRVNYNK